MWTLKFCLSPSFTIRLEPDNRSTNHNHSFRAYFWCHDQDVPIICGVLQSKLQPQTHLWHVPGCANHLWGPPTKITASNTSVRCTRVCQSSVGSSNQNYRLKHICEVYQGVPIICGVLQPKLQPQTHLWGVPGCANHLWGLPIKITGSNTSVACTRVCQSSVGSSNWNYRLKHICGVYQGVSNICGVLQSKLQAQTHLWHVLGCANHLWGPPIKITASNTSVRCTRVCQSSVGSSNQNYRLKHICGMYQGVPIICGVLQSKLQAQTHLWGVPGCANHLWDPPIEITGSNTSVACTRVCQSSVGSSNQNYRLKHLWHVPGYANHLWGPPIKITGSNTSVGCTRVCQTSVGSSNQNYSNGDSLWCSWIPELSIQISIYKSNWFPTILYKTESQHQKYALKLWLWLVLLLSGSSLLVKDGDKQNFKVHITSLLHVASSKSRDEVFLQVAF